MMKVLNEYSGRWWEKIIKWEHRKLNKMKKKVDDVVKINAWEKFPLQSSKNTSD